jgi:hypothetical protein
MPPAPPAPNPITLGTNTFSTNENISLSGQLTATDSSGGTLSFAQSGNPSSGTISSFTSAGAFVYQPNSNFTGTDSFAVRASDPMGNAASGMVTITVRPDPLTLGTTTLSTNEDIPLSGQLTATDSDPNAGTLTFAQTGNPSGGAVSGFTSAGAFMYKPNANFTGADSFPVKVTDAIGDVATGMVMITVRVNQPPVAKNNVLRADGAALSSINVLSNASDPDGDPLTVSIAQQPLVGTASVNADGTIQITSLPGGFKGVIRFQYSVADPTNASATGTVAVFVGADPFRVLFSGDATGNGSAEVYLADFVSTVTAMTQATQGTLRLAGFTAADNGASIAYRRQDTAASGSSDLSWAQTSNPSQQTRIGLPLGMNLVPDAQGKDQFRVSPDGQWLAVIVGSATSSSVYVANVATPTTLSNVSPSGALSAAHPRFSADSKNLYFLASPVQSGANNALYVAFLGTTTPAAQVSAANQTSSDEVEDYSVAPDLSTILLQAVRAGALGLYYVDPRQLMTEYKVNHTLAANEILIASTVALAPGHGGAWHGERVAYTTQSSIFRTYVAEVSTTPNPRPVGGAGAIVVGFRPDDAALLYTQGAQIFETIIDSGTPDQMVGAGGAGWYDSTGNIVLLEQSLASGGTPPTYPALAVTERGSFGTTQPLGTPVLAAQYVDASGFDRGITLIGEGPTTGAAPASAHLALVNALAPSTLLYLANFMSPLQLTTSASQIVTY